MKAMRTLLAATGIAIALAVPAIAADEYPTRPVRIIVPFDPGGINETGARIVATQLSERMGKQFIIEFKPGAGGMVGTEVASRAAPDGYTIAVVSVANAVHPALYNLTYDLRKAFEPVAMLLTSLMTNYELGLMRVIPMHLHLWADAIAGIFLALSPWVLGYADDTGTNALSTRMARTTSRDTTRTQG